MDGRAIQIGADVVRRAVHDALAGLLGAPGHMGGDDAVGGSEQGVVRTDGLGVHHIQAGGRQLARFQGVGDVLLVNQLSAGVVDQDGPVLHLGNAGLVDHLLIIRSEVAVEEHHVGLSQQGIQVHILSDGLAGVVAETIKNSLCTAHHNRSAHSQRGIRT